MATATVSETLLKRDLAHIRSRPRRRVSQSEVEDHRARGAKPGVKTCGAADRKGDVLGQRSSVVSEGDVSTGTWAIAHRGGLSGEWHVLGR